MNLSNTSSRKLLEDVKETSDSHFGMGFATLIVQLVTTFGLIVGGLTLNDKIKGVASQVEDVHGHVSTQNNRTPDVSVYILKNGKYVKAEESSTWDTYYYSN